MKLICCLVILLCPSLTRGQIARPLSVGDKVPEMPLHTIINFKDSTASLSAFKGKVVILDFWATWCSACLLHLRETDSLQKLLKDNLRFLLVSTVDTRDTKEKIESLFKKRAAAGDTCLLPVIINDTVLNRLFAHRLLPHYVWINTAGIVSGITNEDAFTVKNVITLFKEGKISVAPKQDVMDYTAKLPLLQDGNGGNADKLLFRSTFSRYLEGLGSGARINDDGINKKICFLNTSILSLYQAALGFDANRMIIFTNDSSRYFITNQSDAAWHNNLYCYEYTQPLHAPESTGKAAMVNDLNNRLQLNGRMESRTVTCYILIKTGKSPAIPNNTEKVAEGVKEPSLVLRKEQLYVLLQQLNAQSPESPYKPIFLDETGFTGTLSLELFATIDNLPFLKRELQAYGFNLVTATRELSMFILTKLNPY